MAASDKFLKITRGYYYIDEDTECDALQKYIDVRLKALLTLEEDALPKVLKVYGKASANGGKFDLKYLIVIARVIEDMYELLDVPLQRGKDLTVKGKENFDF
jgi:hypothetical protein